LAVQLDYLAQPPAHDVLPDVATAAERLQRATPGLSAIRALEAAQRLTEVIEGGVRWRWDPLLRTRAGLSFGDGALNGDFGQLLSQLDAPITFVYGDAGMAANANGGDMASSPAGERLVLHGGHNLHYDAPEELAEIIARAAGGGRAAQEREQQESS
jgi:pimeloyl-ACP methyl ester carboxylesterase